MKLQFQTKHGIYHGEPSKWASTPEFLKNISEDSALGGEVWVHAYDGATPISFRFTDVVVIAEMDDAA